MKAVIPTSKTAAATAHDGMRSGCRMAPRMLPTVDGAEAREAGLSRVRTGMQLLQNVPLEPELADIQANPILRGGGEEFGLAFMITKNRRFCINPKVSGNGWSDVAHTSAAS